MTAPVELHLPAPERIALGDLLARLGDAPPAMRPFAPEILSLFASLSAALLRDSRARRHPELQALGFWLGPGAVERLRRQYLAAAGDAILAPRGLVFHIPPANVDTIFVYSWALATLAGNRSIVRLPGRRSPQIDLLVGLLRDLLAARPDIAGGTVMLAYGHDDSVTAALSSRCDLRVIWGGDATVAHIRSLPLPPHATEMTFVDRFSLAAIAADALLDCDAAALERLAEAFFNDMFWFDQMACSSPRLLVWVGERRRCAAAADRFAAALAATVARKGYAVDAGTGVNKLAYLYRAVLDHPVSRLQRSGSALAVLTAESLPDFREDVHGAGTLFQAAVPSLLGLVPFVRRKDQTLGQFGFDRDRLTELVLALNGRGIDRIVPIGEALSFDHVWDGYDLLAQFTRKITVRPSR